MLAIPVVYFNNGVWGIVTERKGLKIKKVPTVWGRDFFRKLKVLQYSTSFLCYFFRGFLATTFLATFLAAFFGALF